MVFGDESRNVANVNFGQKPAFLQMRYHGLLLKKMEVAINNNHNHNKNNSKTEFMVAPKGVVVPNFQFFQSSFEFLLISAVLTQTCQSP